MASLQFYDIKFFQDSTLKVISIGLMFR